MHTHLTGQSSQLTDVFSLQAKILVFLTTGKQVKFALEAFRRLRPGVVLRALHGKMKQMKRMAVFYDFSEVLACLPLLNVLHLLHRRTGFGNAAEVASVVLHA